MQHAEPNPGHIISEWLNMRQIAYKMGQNVECRLLSCFVWFKGAGPTDRPTDRRTHAHMFLNPSNISILARDGVKVNTEFKWPYTTWHYNVTSAEVRSETVHLSKSVEIRLTVRKRPYRYYLLKQNDSAKAQDIAVNVLRYRFTNEGAFFVYSKQNVRTNKQKR